MIGIALVILEIILETNSTHGFILAICLNPVGFDGQRGTTYLNHGFMLVISWEVTRWWAELQWYLELN